MFFLRVFISLLLFTSLWPTAAKAAVSCKAAASGSRYLIASVGKNSKATISSKDPLVSVEHLQEIASLYREMIQLIDGYLPVPANLHIDVVFREPLTPYSTFLGQGPFYSSNKGLVHIPYVFSVERNGVEREKHPVYSRPIHIHEIGHAFNDVFFREQIPAWKEMKVTMASQFDFRNKSGDYSKKAYDLMSAHLPSDKAKEYESNWGGVAAVVAQVSQKKEERLKLLLKKDKSGIEEIDREIERLQQILEARAAKVLEFLQASLPKSVYEEYFRLSMEANDLGRKAQLLNGQVSLFRDLISPYDELLADTYMVVTSGDPSLPSKALDFSVKEKKAHKRHYDRGITIDDLTTQVKQPSEIQDYIYSVFRGVLGTVSIYPNEPSAFNAYYILDATKTHLWKWYISNPTFNRNKGLLLKTISAAVARELNARIADPNLTWLSPKEINIRLIKAMDSEFSRIP